MTVAILRNAVKLYWLFFPIERFVFFFFTYLCLGANPTLSSAFTSVFTILNILLVSLTILKSNPNPNPNPNPALFSVRFLRPIPFTWG